MLLAVVLLLAGVPAPHWSVGAFTELVVFSAVPLLCWLIAAPRSAAAPLVGLVLAGASVVPGVLLGPGGLDMYRVLPAGLWVMALYLPLGLLVVAIAGPVLDYLARRKASGASSRGPSARAWITSATILFVFFICGTECGGLRPLWEGSEIPAAPTAAIIGTLPAGLATAGEPERDGGSSVSSMSYNIVSTRGLSADEIANELADSIAGLTGWPVPKGFAARCYRAAGFSEYSGRFCITIQRTGSRADAVTLTVSAWDNRFGGFSPVPG